jgi:hypothetical protein
MATHEYMMKLLADHRASSALPGKGFVDSAPFSFYDTGEDPYSGGAPQTPVAFDQSVREVAERALPSAPVAYKNFGQWFAARAKVNHGGVEEYVNPKTGKKTMIRLVHEGDVTAPVSRQKEHPKLQPVPRDPIAEVGAQYGPMNDLVYRGPIPAPPPTQIPNYDTASSPEIQYLEGEGPAPAQDIRAMLAGNPMRRGEDGTQYVNSPAPFRGKGREALSLWSRIVQRISPLRFP